jgi:type IV pilus assembly protein PilZ
MASSFPSSLAETSRWEESAWSGGSARSGVLQLRMDTPMDLYQAYIPVFTEGGLFVPSSRDYQLGDELYGLLTLPQETKRYPLIGYVAWITPAHAPAGRPQGVGLRFAADAHGVSLKKKIETALGPLLASKRTNYKV